MDAPSGIDARSGTTPPPPTTLPSADPEQVVPVPDSSTHPLPSPPVPESAQEEKRDAAGAATAEKRKASPPATRPTTSGKSVQTMEKLLGKKYKVNLKMKGTTEAEQEDEEDELMEELEDGSHNGSDWKPEEEPRKSGATRRKQKKCRVVSAPTVDSDGGEELAHEPGWPVVLSKRRCEGCLENSWACYVFAAQPRGRQRYACQRCKSLKKDCSRSEARKKELARIIAARRAERRSKMKEADDDDEDDEDNEETEDEEEAEENEGEKVENVDSRKRKRSKSGDGRKDAPSKKQRRAKSGGGAEERKKRRQTQETQRRKVKKSTKEKPEKDGEEGGKEKEKGKEKGKGKKKAEENEEEDSMEVDRTEPVPKTERQVDVQWTTCKFSIFLTNLYKLTIN